MNATELIKALKDRIRTQPTKLIVESIELIGGGYDVSENERRIRACLFDIYEEREGEDAVDALMDKIGLGL